MRDFVQTWQIFAKSVRYVSHLVRHLVRHETVVAQGCAACEPSCASRGRAGAPVGVRTCAHVPARLPHMAHMAHSAAHASFHTARTHRTDTARSRAPANHLPFSFEKEKGCAADHLAMTFSDRVARVVQPVQAFVQVFVQAKTPETVAPQRCAACAAKTPHAGTCAPARTPAGADAPARPMHTLHTLHIRTATPFPHAQTPAHLAALPAQSRAPANHLPFLSKGKRIGGPAGNPAGGVVAWRGASIAAGSSSPLLPALFCAIVEACARGFALRGTQPQGGGVNQTVAQNRATVHAQGQRQ